MWTPDVIRFCLLILIGASLLVQHMRLLRRALRTRSLSVLTKLACFIPPVPVYVAYRHGARRSFWVWLCLVGAYLVLFRSRAPISGWL